MTVGGELVVTSPQINDGDQSVTLLLQNFGPNQVVAFTIDVDDTTGAREITVSNSEMQGATVSAVISNKTFEAVVGKNSEVSIAITDCMA